MASSDVTALQAIANFRANRRGPVQGVADTADQVSRNLDALKDLAENGGLASITLWTTGPMSVSWGQYTDNKAVFDRMRGGFSLSVALVPASAAASVQADRLVTSFTVRDQAAEISARFDTLNSASKLTQIFTSDSRPLAGATAATLLPAGGGWARVDVWLDWRARRLRVSVDGVYEIILCA